MPVSKGEDQSTFWVIVVSDTLTGLLCIEDLVKINAATYNAFLDKHFRPWRRKQLLRPQKTLLFMHVNAPTHAVTYTIAWSNKIGIKAVISMVPAPMKTSTTPVVYG